MMHQRPKLCTLDSKNSWLFLILVIVKAFRNQVQWEKVDWWNNQLEWFLSQTRPPRPNPQQLRPVSPVSFESREPADMRFCPCLSVPASTRGEAWRANTRESWGRRWWMLWVDRVRALVCILFCTNYVNLINYDLYDRIRYIFFRGLQCPAMLRCHKHLQIDIINRQKVPDASTDVPL